MPIIAATNLPTQVTQVKFTRTVLGFFNIRLANGDDNTFINLSPGEFKELFPDVNQIYKYGCGEISSLKITELFSSKKVVRL